MFTYRSLLKEAWQITWHHKYLWFLGLFATIVAGGGAWQYQTLSQNLNQGIIGGSYYQLESILTINNILHNFFLGISGLFHQNIWVIISVLSVLIMVIVILGTFIWLAICSQAGLINDTKEILNSKKKDLKLSLRHSLTVGNRHFWSVLGLNLIVKILIAAVFFIVSLPLLFLVIKNTGLLATLYVFLFVFFVPVSVALSLTVNYVIAYRVLDNTSFVVSLEKGIKLFLKNWLVSIELGIILFIINFFASFLILLLIGAFLLPLLLLGLLLNSNLLIFIIIFLAFLVVLTFGAIMTTFEISTWTSLFLKLKNRKIRAKLERIFKK